MSDYGVVLINLGSPASTEVSDVKKYLTQFLMDPRVIDIPAWKRFLLVRGIIAPFRAPKSAEAYKRIWWEEGSPLIVISRRVQSALQDQVDFPVSLGMSYGEPSIESAIKALLDKGVKRIKAIPLYPHYAMSTTESVVADVEKAMHKLSPGLPFEIHKPFYQDKDYIEALFSVSKRFFDMDYDHILFSYHGLPERHLHKTDPTGCHCLKVENCCEKASPAHDVCYRHHCFQTTKALAQKAGLDPSKYSVAFQSRLGKDPWLSPNTEDEIKRLAAEGKKHVQVICPSFVSDCLETLEEIGLEGAHTFEEEGGESLKLIPCMNEAPEWVDVLAKWAQP